MVDNKINKFRHVILEILHRLPNNEVLKPYVQELLLLVMNVVDVDNEDNAIQGLRVVFDLQKNYRPQLEKEVPRFLQVRSPWIMTVISVTLSSCFTPLSFLYHATITRLPNRNSSSSDFLSHFHEPPTKLFHFFLAMVRNVERAEKW